MKIRISGIEDDSIVDGPGLRMTVFVQGCSHNCEGCHNPQTHDFNGGEESDTEKILKSFFENPLLAGITLSGGEPFEQPKACSCLAQAVRKSGKNIYVYTGYTIEQLLEKSKENSDIKEFLNNIDVLIDGPFILAQRSLALKFRGSKNQRIIDVQQFINDVY